MPKIYNFIRFDARDYAINLALKLVAYKKLRWYYLKTTEM